jgi:hypothetical protein
MAGRRQDDERLPPDAAAHQRVVGRLGAERPQRDGRAPLGQAVLDDLDVAVEHRHLEQADWRSRSLRRTLGRNSELALAKLAMASFPVNGARRRPQVGDRVVDRGRRSCGPWAAGACPRRSA